MYSYGSPHMAAQKQGDQPERTFSEDTGCEDTFSEDTGCEDTGCEDTGCYPEDLPRAMNDREEWRERVRDIRATSTI